ncbi:MAG: haloacid dehalogenase-like hydrolase [Rhodanobacteraceae bacterium]
MTTATGGADTARAPVDADARPVVLFDFDGVLVRGDAFNSFLRQRFRRGLWRVLLALPLSPLLAVLACWRNGRLRAGRLLARCALAGVGDARYQRLVDRFVEELVRGSRRFSPAAIRVFRAKVGSGARVLIVSGCEERLLRALLMALGIRNVEVVATQLARGWLGQHVARHNVGAAKIVRLAEVGIEPPWQMAFSDAWADVPLLRGACEPVVVNATPQLCKRVERALGRSVTRVEWR